MVPKSEREAVELIVELIRTAKSAKQYKELIEPAEWLLNTSLPGCAPDFKQRAIARPKETLLSLAYILTKFLEDTELTHYLTSDLNLSAPVALEIEAKVSKSTKRRI